MITDDDFIHLPELCLKFGDLKRILKNTYNIDAMSTHNYAELAKSNVWGLSEEDIKTIEEEGSFDSGGHWVFSNVDGSYEAVYDGNYMHVFGSLEDLMARENEVDYYDYSPELSEERGEETFVNAEGKIREYRNGGNINDTDFTKLSDLELINLLKGTKGREMTKLAIEEVKRRNPVKKKDGGGIDDEKVYEVSLYYKDEPEKIIEGYLIKEGQDPGEDDDDIFYYVESENELKSLMDPKGVSDFVITHYELVNEYRNGGGVGRVKVGVFNEEQLRNKEDKKAIEKAQKETGLTYIDSKIIKKGGKMFMEVYLVPTEEYTSSKKFTNGGDVISADDLYSEIQENAGSYCMDEPKDRMRFIAWLKENCPKFGLDCKKAISIINKTKSLCTDNDEDMGWLIYKAFGLETKEYKEAVAEGYYEENGFAEDGKKIEEKEKIKVSFYKWGEYVEDEEIDLIDLPEVLLNYDQLLGFTIREEDEGKFFYASDLDIDEDDDGTAVKRAYAVDKKYEPKYTNGGGIKLAAQGMFLEGEFEEIVKKTQDYLAKYPYIWSKKGKNYVPIEGWQYAAAMMGLSARVIDAKPIAEKNGWIAQAEVVNQQGVVVCSGFGFVGRDEKKWEKATESDLESFAQTKAVSRALRNCISYLIKAAGYSTTPAEEMYGINDAPKGKSKPVKSKDDEPFIFDRPEYAFPEESKSVFTRSTQPPIQKSTGNTLSEAKTMLKDVYYAAIAKNTVLVSSDFMEKMSESILDSTKDDDDAMHLIGKAYDWMMDNGVVLKSKIFMGHIRAFLKK